MTEAARSSGPVDSRLSGFMKWAVVNRQPLGEMVQSFRRGYMLAAVELCRGNRTKAAKLCGIHRNTLQRAIGPELPLDPRGSRPRKAGK